MIDKPDKSSDKSANSDHQQPVEGEKIHLFDKPENVQRLLRGFYFCCLLLVLAEFVIHRHVVHPWEGLFAFHAGYGFVACVVLVLIASEMRKLLMRDENYYEADSRANKPESKLVIDGSDNGGSDDVGC